MRMAPHILLNLTRLLFDVARSFTCSAAGMDLDELLHFLEARDKVRITGGVVYPGGSPACEP